MEFGIYDIIDDGENIYTKPKDGKSEINGGKGTGIYGSTEYGNGILCAVSGTAEEAV